MHEKFRFFEKEYVGLHGIELADFELRGFEEECVGLHGFKFRFFEKLGVQKFGDPFKKTRRAQLCRWHGVSRETEPPGSGSEEISGPTIENHGFCGRGIFCWVVLRTRPPLDPHFFRPVC